MIKNEYRYSEITGKILESAFAVHKILGSGFHCLIYQKALEKEMRMNGLSFCREHKMPVFYKSEKIGTRRVDFLVENVISVEMKTLPLMNDDHMAQAVNYLETFNVEAGLLINFGAKSLQYRRLINSKYSVRTV